MASQLPVWGKPLFERLAELMNLDPMLIAEEGMSMEIDNHGAVMLRVRMAIPERVMKELGLPYA